MNRATTGLIAALPFWVSLLFLPVFAVGAVMGGWFLVLPTLLAVIGYTILDAMIGHDRENLDPETPDAALFWHKLITLIWCPLQLVLIFGAIAFVTRTAHLAVWEEVVLFLGIGTLTGGIGIVYAHELIHQSSRLERGLGEVLLISVGYGHFVTEHLAVHHAYVCTPKDPATARFGEGFYRYFLRVIPQSFQSAWQVEASRTARKHGSKWDCHNPFWRYLGGTVLCALLAYGLGGFWGVVLFAIQAGFAVWQLEQINYIEHYGLERREISPGKYEPVRPHHSWNADYIMSNYLLINLQRHADHHAKPTRRYPLLQTYTKAEAPQLPFGYPLLTWAVYVPPLWHRMMDPKVRAWRKRFYPEVTQWSA